MLDRPDHRAEIVRPGQRLILPPGRNTQGKPEIRRAVVLRPSPIAEPVRRDFLTAARAPDQGTCPVRPCSRKNKQGEPCARLAGLVRKKTVFSVICDTTCKRSAVFDGKNNRGEFCPDQGRNRGGRGQDGEQRNGAVLIATWTRVAPMAQGPLYSCATASEKRKDIDGFSEASRADAIGSRPRRSPEARPPPNRQIDKRQHSSRAIERREWIKAAVADRGLGRLNWAESGRRSKDGNGPDSGLIRPQRPPHGRRRRTCSKDAGKGSAAVKENLFA